MSNSTLDQLIELFPAISEEFLSGIHDAHKDDEPTIEELIDVILSFEFPPPRETPNEHSLDIINDNELNDTESEVPIVTNNRSEVDVPVEDEFLQKSIPDINCNLFSKNVESSLEKSIEIEHQDVLDSDAKEIPVAPIDQLGGNCPINNGNDARISPEIKCEVNPDTELKLTENLYENHCKEIVIPEHQLNNCSSTVSYKESNEEEDGDDNDCSPECSIRYLMKEVNVMERYNITHHYKSSGGTSEPDSGDSKMSCDLSHVKISKKNKVSPRVKNSGIGTKRKRDCKYQKKGKSSGEVSSHCSTKRVSLRSCKVKNEEERLRRKLINQSRLMHEMQEKNTNSILCSSKFLDLDKKYSLLCGIFTDANPTYLLDQCEFLTDQEKILAFISQNIEFRDYPKIDTIKEESQLMEEFQCTVEKFLAVIPDPAEEFSSLRYVRAGYEENAEIYLKARYEGLSDEEVKDLLRNNNYNLTALCCQLDEEGRTATPGVLDYTPLHHPASVFFHQEVWYIEHRKEVQDYLDSTIEAIRVQEEINRPPPPVEEVFECEICAEEIVEYQNLGTCDGKTGHLFCINCIRRSVEVRIGDGGTSFPCLVNCGSFIPLRTVEELLPKHTFDILMGKIQEEEIRKANIPGVETCPFCPYAYGPGPEDELVFTCLNPTCMKLSCRICRKEDHTGEMCELLKSEDEERARHIIEDRMAEALMRTCYNCGKNFVKTGGCNKMACECGAKMCYVCRVPVQDYSHFNGPGGDNTDRCPLYSDDQDLHDRPVEATAERIFNEIAANNPQLNLDRAKLIPK